MHMNLSLHMWYCFSRVRPKSWKRIKMTPVISMFINFLGNFIPCPRPLPAMKELQNSVEERAQDMQDCDLEKRFHQRLEKFMESKKKKVNDVRRVIADAVRVQDRQRMRIKRLTEELEFQTSHTTLLLDEIFQVNKTLKDVREHLLLGCQCILCFNELDDYPSHILPAPKTGCSPPPRKLKKRSVFIPCMHANTCIKCARNVYAKEPRRCPTCKEELLAEPKILYL